MQDLKTEKNNLNKILDSIPRQKKLSENDIVYGRIISIKSKMMIVAINHCQENRIISPNDIGILFIQDVSNEYVKNLEDLFKDGDIIKAKVLEVKPFEYKISTKDKNLGVIKGFCKKCKQELPYNKSQNKVICTNCNTIQSKKFAK